MSGDRPSLIVAGLSGDSGKTVVSLALALAARERGLEVRAFKKGPDYIDAAWLTWAAGHPARNLDTFLMALGTVTASFERHATARGLNVIEGNRGLYDGVDPVGTHSTAELAKLLGVPVILVVSVTRMTRTAAALVLGCQSLDPDVPIAGVIVNRIATERHERVIRDAIESACGVPVLGALPRLQGTNLLPSRHLGLVTPDEHARMSDLHPALAELAARSLDVDRLLGIAGTWRKGPAIRDQGLETREQGAGTREADTPAMTAGGAPSRPVTIGYLRDSAFSFYYPENLEALEAEGARLIAFSALAGDALPSTIDALYIGGGFPETHAARLSANRPFLESLAAAAHAGLPIYAECGGLMLLARSIRWEGQTHSMAGVLPIDIALEPRPQGHGYTELMVDVANPFFPEGLTLRGHEFHYSRVSSSEQSSLPTVCHVHRGAGMDGHRDAFVIGNVWASYTHLHALGCADWAPNFVRLARGPRDVGAGGPAR
jgi:cobyrinic acid a,c-diamide synthase